MQIQLSLHRPPYQKGQRVEQNTGALGHGLPISVGTAIGGKLDENHSAYLRFSAMVNSPKGSNWEAALTAAHYGLDNLCAIIDHNKLQITGRTV
jgi:transketolase